MGTVTTFICCKNHGQFLRQAFSSCMEQTHQPTEILLLDDGSMDSTAKIIESLRDQHPGIVRPIIHKESRGNIQSYNECISQARCEYLHLMAADDVLFDNQFYRRASDIMDMDRDIGFVSTGLRWMKEDGHISHDMAILPPYDGKVPPIVALRTLGKIGNFINGGGTLIRTEVQREAGYYDERLPYSADFLNWIRVLSHGHPAFFIRECGYLYRRHQNQMTAQKGADEKERELCQAYLAKALVEAEEDTPMSACIARS